MTNPPPARTVYPFDARALTAPVDRAAVKAFWQAVRQQHPTSTNLIVVWVIAGFVLLIGFGTLTMVSAGIVFAGASSGSSILGVAGVLPLVIPIAIAAISIPLIRGAMHKQRETAYRVAQFAHDNGMTYLHEVPDAPLPGMIFQQGNERKASMLVRGQQPRFVEFGNQTYTTGGGKNKTTHNWGYVAVKLDVPLPNIVLDALGNNTLGTNLPASFRKEQHLSLEGDFDRYFSLYCPAGYEADALYLFTPDIMARFIDNAAQLDVEIVDDWMFFYMRRAAVTTDAATWAWLFSAVGAMMTKFDQWARWRDERLGVLRQAQQPSGIAQQPRAGTPLDAQAGPLNPALQPLPLAPPPGVALEGRRLKKRMSWTTIIVLLIVGGLFVLPNIIGVLMLLVFGR